MQALTITNGDLLGTLIAWMHRQILQIISYMISSAGVYIPIKDAAIAVSCAKDAGPGRSNPSGDSSRVPNV